MDARTEKVRAALARRDAAELLEVLGWATTDVPLVGAAWKAWGWHGEAFDARLLAHGTGCRVVSMQGRTRRDLVLAVARHAPLEPVLWLFEADEELTVAVAQRTDDGRLRMRTMSVDRDSPDAMGLQRLTMLANDAIARPAEVDPAVATAAHLAEVLDSEGLTRAFFEGFREALERMSETLVDGPDEPAERWHAALVVLLRLVFVYFLQREGVLDGDRRYLVRRLRADGEDFFARVLRPLFFGVLNTPPAERSAAARLLGDVPFLNGGLFEPTEMEREYPDLRWTTEVLRTVVEGLFERFHFTAMEPAGDDDARVVDPEMLGKVFEGLMYGDERARSGSFYTPRDVVRGMVDTTLDAYLDDRAEDGIDRDAALQTVRVLDPAVGTGAFLLETFASLRRRRREAGLAVDYAALRRLVHDHLFGVDRNRTAVRLCELRLWLAMLSAMREAPGPMEPLPNLSHRIVAGDSLLDGISLVRRRAGGLHPSVLVGVIQLESRLERTQRRFLESHGDDKLAHRRELERVERELQMLLLEGRRRLIQRRLEPLRALQDSPDLFGDTMANDSQREFAGELQQRLEQLEAMVADLRHDRADAPGFGYETRFGAAAREGFDVIVTNPPWVRAQRLDRTTRDVLASRYETASGGLWAGARELGIRTPYGAQPDLAALFVERCMELLRPGGRLAALIPAKLFRALHASPMRRLLMAHRIERIEDHSEADRQLFDATVYPGILHVRKATPRDGLVDVRIWRGPECCAFRCPADELSPSGSAGEPWLLVPPDVERVLARVKSSSRMLGADDELAPRRGIFTGTNDVFLRPRGGFEAELGPRVRPFVRPLLTGSGLGERPTQEVLWCYTDGALLHDVPPWLQHYFEQHRTRLERRSDYDARAPLWQLFRVRADSCTPKVAWRDMSVLLEPVVVDARSVPANTVYYVPFDDREEARGFARWMASLEVRTMAHAIAEHARGGWRRHFAWVVRMLPVPEGLDDWASFDAYDAFGLDAADREVLACWLGLDAQDAA